MAHFLSRDAAVGSDLVNQRSISLDAGIVLDDCVGNGFGAYSFSDGKDGLFSPGRSFH
jgi:hypothetical protein